MLDSAQPPLPGTGIYTADKAEPERFTVVSVRLRAAELQEFSQQVRALGLTNSMALRIAARRIGGFLEVEQETRRDLKQAMQQIKQVSGNLANLADTYSANSAKNLEEFKQERRELSHAFLHLESLLRQILNISHRRTDGRELLEVAAERKRAKE
ncbi:type IV secretion system T-DNA border endonuclease VirD1 [Phyllobacterium myrsinacearum]|uniref:DNA mobilization endonuclease VirD1/MobC family subunit n=1 Tax=Phyllobacterium myrsinacearum TaxID=28101 RepID=UPI0010E42A21|nr:DNA mobilization endonuclease VirD1/MobC family subunit [Phyllobacterium myrsinacearum]RZS76850.1 type IV secretion system T-DNA border endonuclease VirD1 [Phyllobacterium myrsinacearum]